MKTTTMPAILAGIVLAMPVLAQSTDPAPPSPPATSAEVQTSPDGQMTGTVSNGGATSRVQTGPPAADPNAAPPSRSLCPQGSTGQTVRVVSPDGNASSSASVSTSSSGGRNMVSTVGGSGSPGSQVAEERCGLNAPTGRVDARVDARVKPIAPH